MNFQIKELSIKDFNNNLNNSGDLKDKYNRWSEHRENIKKLVDKALLENPESKEVIVFGAGMCNDIDLNYLGEKFDNIILTDVDKRSIEYGFEIQNIDDNLLKKFTIKEIEYTGLDHIGFFEKAFDLIKNRSLESKIDILIEESLEKINAMNILDEYKDKFPIVLSAPVYSQLLYTQVNVLFDAFNYFNFYKNNQINKFKKKVYRYMPKIIKRYNDLIISVTKDDGYIISWIDMFEGKNTSKEMREINNYLEKSNNKDLKEYIDKVGMELSLIGQKDFLERVDIKDYDYWMWPFDNKKEYLVYGSLGKVKK